MLSNIPRVYRPSKGYNGGPNTFPPRNPERLAARIKAGQEAERRTRKAT